MKKQTTATLLLILTLTTIYSITIQTNNIQAAKADLEILSYTYYTASTNTLAKYAGDLVVVGEVQNTGTTNIGYAYVIATAYINDTEVAQAQHQVYGNNIKPNQIVPFYLDFLPENSITGDNSWISNITNVIAYIGYVYNSDANQYQDLQATSSTSTSSGTYTVTGKVTNTGSQTIGDVRVITTFYNSEGKVVNINFTDVLSTDLQPNSQVSFTAQPVDYYPSSNIKSYAILIQSEIPEGTSTSGTPSSGATPTPSGTNQPTATPTATTVVTPTPTQQTQTDTDNTALIIIAAVTIAAIIIVAATLLIHKRKNQV